MKHPPKKLKKKRNLSYKKYKELITKEAVSDEGLFKVHKLEDKYYYEIPFDKLEKDMLLVSQVKKLGIRQIKMG